MAPVFFANPNELRKWLEANHKKENELIIGYYKAGSQKTGMTYPQSVIEALCFGWIDGIARTIDHESYCVRFTPRKPKSNWSAVNIARAEELIKQKKMTLSGLIAYEKRSDARTAVYSYENQPEKLTPELETSFIKNKIAWDFFQTQPPSYRKSMIYWVMSAKQKATQLSRLNKLIEASVEGKRVF